MAGLEPSLADNIAAVRARIGDAARRAGRRESEVTLVAVSKTHPPEVVAAAAAWGLRVFGENRVEEAAAKRAALVQRTDLAWHMVGHIQSRKARDAVHAGFALIHSVDTLKLAERLARFSAENQQVSNVLLECNVSGEASKTGFSAAEPGQWDELRRTLEPLAALPGLRVRGLMTMAPIVTEPEAARPYFARLRALRDFLAERWPASNLSELSMGMTDDFEAAIEEGATLVRIGRAIFGERS